MFSVSDMGRKKQKKTAAASPNAPKLDQKNKPNQNGINKNLSTPKNTNNLVSGKIQIRKAMLILTLQSLEIRNKWCSLTRPVFKATKTNKKI